MTKVNLNAKHDHEFTEETPGGALHATGHLYEVTITGMVEIGFDQTPTERELRVALADNLAAHIYNMLDIDQDEFIQRDLTYTWVDTVPMG